MTHCVRVRRFLHLEHTGEAWSHLSFAFLHGSHAACWPFLRRVELALSDLGCSVSVELSPIVVINYRFCG
jgi:hypothetical protein